jgi:hypothetical protein
MGINTTQNFTLILKLLRKIVNKKVTYRQKSVQNLRLSSSILLTCKSFWQIP